MSVVRRTSFSIYCWL